MTLARKLIINPRYAEGPWDTDKASAWMQFNVSYGMFSSANTTVDYDLAGFPAGVLVEGAFVRARANWTGGAINAATLSVGPTGTPTAYVAAVSVFSGCPKTLPGTTIVPGTFLNAATPTDAGTVRVRLIVTNANANVLTGGSADVFLKLCPVKLYAGG